MDREYIQPLLNWAEFNRSTNVFSRIESSFRDQDVEGLWGYFIAYFDGKDIDLNLVYRNVVYDYKQLYKEVPKRKNMQLLAIERAYKMINNSE